jgi:hypothetical protein
MPPNDVLKLAAYPRAEFEVCTVKQWSLPGRSRRKPSGSSTLTILNPTTGGTRDVTLVWARITFYAVRTAQY